MDDKEQESDDPYKIKVFSTNKDELYQPDCCNNDVLPKLPFGALVIGKSGSGKTQAVINLLTNDNLLHEVFDYVYIYSGIKPDKELLKPLKVPDKQIFVDFSEENISNLMTKMEMTVEKLGMSKTPSVLFLFDDILGSPKILKSKTISKLCTTNRHMNISYIMLSQYYKKIPAVVRTNASYYMIFPSSMVELEKICEELCPPNLGKKEFIRVLQHATSQKYSFFSMNTKCDYDKQMRKNFGTILNL